MGGYKNIQPDEGKKFSSEYQPANPGRKKKIYTILKEKGFSPSDIKDSFGELAFYTIPELDELIADKEKPIIVIIVAKAMKKAMEDSDWSRIKEIMEHTIGKPDSKVDVTSGGEKIEQVFQIGDQKIKF